VSVVGSGLLAQSIGKRFNASTESTWLSQSITILTVVLSPPMSQCADLWGRKWPIAFAMLCGCVGSIVASRAQSMGTVIAGYCITGICFGAQPLLHAVVSEVLPRKQRPLAQGAVNATAGLGGFLGVMMGGALLRHNDLDNYRIYLYVVAAIFFVAAAGIVVGYNPPPRDLQLSLSNGEKLRSLHWISYLLFTPGLVLFCIALSWSRNPYPWSNSRIIAPFVIGVLLIIAFIIYEWRFTKTGMLNHDLFLDRNFPIALVTIFCEGVAFFTANTYFAFEVSLFTGKDLLNAGLPFAVTFLAGVVVAWLAGIYSTKFKALRLPIIVGYLCLTSFFAAMAGTYTQRNLDASFYGLGVILGFGTGIILPIVMVAAQLATNAALISTASALVIAIRSLGGTVGLAINNAIFNSDLSTQIPKKIAAATLPLGLPPSSLGQLIGGLASNDPAALAHIPGATPQIIGAGAQALIEAYAIGFRDCYIAAACFSALSILGMFQPFSHVCPYHT
jgi:MFS family permease